MLGGSVLEPPQLGQGLVGIASLVTSRAATSPPGAKPRGRWGSVSRAVAGAVSASRCNRLSQQIHRAQSALQRRRSAVTGQQPGTLNFRKLKSDYSTAV